MSQRVTWIAGESYGEWVSQCVRWIAGESSSELVSELIYRMRLSEGLTGSEGVIW